jgi:hypothetical protein
MVCRHLCQLAAECARSRPDDEAVRVDAIGIRDGSSPRQRLAERFLLRAQVRVQGELLRDDQWCDEDDVRPAVGGEPAAEVERVLRLLQAEQRYDDAAVTKHQSS